VFRSSDRIDPLELVPGMRRGAPKRNVIVVLVYLFLSLLVGGAVWELLAGVLFTVGGGRRSSLRDRRAQSP
jgi:hypothetical protein